MNNDKILKATITLQIYLDNRTTFAVVKTGIYNVGLKTSYTAFYKRRKMKKQILTFKKNKKN